MICGGSGVLGQRAVQPAAVVDVWAVGSDHGVIVIPVLQGAGFAVQRLVVLVDIRLIHRAVIPTAVVSILAGCSLTGGDDAVLLARSRSVQEPGAIGGLWDPVLALPAALIAKPLHHPSDSCTRVGVRHDTLAGIEKTILVAFPAEGLFGVFDEITDAEGVAEGAVHGESRGVNCFVAVVAPGESVPVGDGEAREFEADEDVLDGARDVVGGVVVDVVDDTEPDEDGEEEALPVGGEDDELDAEELCAGCQRNGSWVSLDGGYLWDRSEGMQISCHANPEYSQGV